MRRLRGVRRRGDAVRPACAAGRHHRRPCCLCRRRVQCDRVVRGCPDEFACGAGCTCGSDCTLAACGELAAGRCMVVGGLARDGCLQR